MVPSRTVARISLLFAALLVLGTPVLMAQAASSQVPLSSYVCQGSQITLFNNTNGYLVSNGGTPPQFSTNGKAYCLNYIQTYHWNDGKGAPLGGLELARISGPAGLPPRTGYIQSQGSSGQGGAPNVNHYVDVPSNPPTIIDGVYQCLDTIRGSWSENAQSGGAGFCIVYATPAVAPGSSTGSTTPTTTPSTSSSSSTMAAWVWFAILAAVLFLAAVVYVVTRRRKMPPRPPSDDDDRGAEENQRDTEQGTTEEGPDDDPDAGGPPPPTSSGQDFAPGGS